MRTVLASLVSLASLAGCITDVGGAPAGSSGGDCPVLHQSLVVHEPSDLDQLPGGCVELDGDLEVVASGLTDLSALADVRAARAVRIERNPQLASLAGLEGITVTGELVVRDDPALTSLADLTGVTRIDHVQITGDAALASLAGLDHLASVGPGGLELADDASLAGLDGLGALTEVTGPLLIDGDAALAHLSGAPALRAAGGLLVAFDPRLVDLGGLDLHAVHGDLAIGDDASLVSIGALSSLDDVDGRLEIGGNPALRSIDGFLAASTSIGGDLMVYQNAALTEVPALGGVGAVGGGVLIQDNPALSGCRAQAAADAIGVVHGQVVVDMNGAWQPC